ncbi:hypothetical protein GEV33_007894 [Tenebrio molitor]|uniref:Uncharacterized protein n=1 Tax=Tenebrio molitor TaxID=7067 RepID=A0A8J6LBW3_TENMO|nr:hypothetical protein GEV33_007894 [Tenebrio molitor]
MENEKMTQCCWLPIFQPQHRISVLWLKINMWVASNCEIFSRNAILPSTDLPSASQFRNDQLTWIFDEYGCIAERCDVTWIWQPQRRSTVVWRVCGGGTIWKTARTLPSQCLHRNRARPERAPHVCGFRRPVMHLTRATEEYFGEKGGGDSTRTRDTCPLAFLT